MASRPMTCGMASPSILHLRLFGCPAYSLIPEQKRRKVDPRSEKLLLVGYMDELKAYKLIHPQTHKGTHTRSVLFHEAALLNRTKDASLLPDQASAPPDGELTASDFEQSAEFSQLGGDGNSIDTEHTVPTQLTVSNNYDQQEISGSNFETTVDSGSTQEANLDYVLGDNQTNEVEVQQQPPSSPKPAPRRSQQHRDRSQWNTPPYSPPDFRIKGTVDITNPSSDSDHTITVAANNSSDMVSTMSGPDIDPEPLTLNHEANFALAMTAAIEASDPVNYS